MEVLVRRVAAGELPVGPRYFGQPQVVADGEVDDGGADVDDVDGLVDDRADLAGQHAVGAGEEDAVAVAQEDLDRAGGGGAARPRPACGGAGRRCRRRRGRRAGAAKTIPVSGVRRRRWRSRPTSANFAFAGTVSAGRPTSRSTRSPGRTSFCSSRTTPVWSSSARVQRWFEPIGPAKQSTGDSCGDGASKEAVSLASGRVEAARDLPAGLLAAALVGDGAVDGVGDGRRAAGEGEDELVTGQPAGGGAFGLDVPGGEDAVLVVTGRDFEGDARDELLATGDGDVLGDREEPSRRTLRATSAVAPSGGWTSVCAVELLGFLDLVGGSVRQDGPGGGPLRGGRPGGQHAPARRPRPLSPICSTQHHTLEHPIYADARNGEITAGTPLPTGKSHGGFRSMTQGPQGPGPARPAAAGAATGGPAVAAAGVRPLPPGGPGGCPGSPPAPGLPGQGPDRRARPAAAVPRPRRRKVRRSPGRPPRGPQGTQGRPTQAPYRPARPSPPGAPAPAAGRRRPARLRPAYAGPPPGAPSARGSRPATAPTSRRSRTPGSSSPSRSSGSSPSSGGSSRPSR